MRLVLGIIAVLVGFSAASVDAQRSRPEPRTPASTPQRVETPESDDVARALFNEGQRLYVEGEYELAVAKWREAYALRPAPALHYNIAQAYGRLGDIQNELDSLRAFVDGVAADDPNAELARMRITALETRMARTGLTFTGLAEGAALRIDGESTAIPAEGELVSRPVGTHSITVRRRGHRPFDAQVEVVQGRTLTVSVVQERLPTVRKPIASYVLLGAGGAAIGAAVGTGVVAMRRSPDAFAGTAEGDRMHRLALATDIVGAVGAAAAVTGLVLFILRDRPETDGFEDSAFRVVPYAASGSGGVLLHGRF